MVVFFDIDGTVVDGPSQIIPESAIRAVEQLGKNGHLAVVNTGRPYSHIDPRVRQMAFGGWICACGMDIRVGGKQLSYFHPDEQMRQFVIQTVEECGMDPLYEADDGSLEVAYLPPRNPHIARETRQMLAKGFAVNDIRQHPGFMKLVAWNGPNAKREEFVSRISEHFTCTFRETEMIELVPKGFSKAEGMAALLAHLGIDQADTLAIGDSTNDLPMFRGANHTVCMAGGMEELKQAAEYVTDTVLNDGIEKALKHYGLI